MNEAMINIQNVNVFYGANQVLRNINIEIPRNQITVILGPSGCGKSTLLKCMNRFLDLVEGARLTGKVTLDGVNLYDNDIDVTKVRKRVGLLAQRPFPLPMSIYENVAYGMHVHEMGKRRDVEIAVRKNLELAGLWDEVRTRLHDPASALSIGQQQRLCLARGLAVEPDILLGDEPTSALDPISAQHIEARLQDLKSRYTIVLVTHILRQARRLADNIVFMYMGEVVEWGPAEEVLKNPKKERTRAYLEGAFY
jgi:phosphate transport system ATP-binding protein